MFERSVACAVIVFAALMAVPAVLLAKEEPKPGSQPMQVVIARSTEIGCEPQCLEWISAQGAIDASTPQQFKKVLNSLGKRKLPILIDSTGGAVNEALAIGRMIRAKGLDVIVTKTAFKQCEKTDAVCTTFKARAIHLAMPQSRLSKCASSCAFILAAGTRRYVGAGAYVGLHKIASTITQVQLKYRVTTKYQYGVQVQQHKQLISEKRTVGAKHETPTEDAVYKKITAYFVEMGIAEAVMPMLLSTPHSSIRWLRSTELTSTKLATDFLNGEQILLPPKPLPGVPVAAAPLASPGVPVMPSFTGMPTCDAAANITTNCVPASNNLPAIPTVAPMIIMPKIAVPVAPAATTPQPTPSVVIAPVAKPRPVATNTKKAAEPKTTAKPRDDGSDPFARSIR